MDSGLITHKKCSECDKPKSSDEAKGGRRNQEMVSRNRECCHREMEGFYAPSVS